MTLLASGDWLTRLASDRKSLRVKRASYTLMSALLFFFFLTQTAEALFATGMHCIVFLLFLRELPYGLLASLTIYSLCKFNKILSFNNILHSRSSLLLIEILVGTS